eukprot:TRINITY_DN1962_c0_g1_i1.p1 TRINITY_DN1962_c0_g1~~TRINITY_DN1962_c0_g1_i1.p1  ORF type:complete len:320 (+),score=62.77 TRINITY_DN1962_c0_g1_i1:60-1019(+)
MDFPVRRTLLNVVSNGFDELLRESYVRIKIMTYNTLATSLLRRKSYAYASDQSLKWKSRRVILVKEIVESGADIACLQECDTALFDSFWQPQMKAKGYSGVFKAFTAADHALGHHGVATFYRADRFVEVGRRTIDFRDLAAEAHGVEAEELDRPNAALILALRPLAAGFWAESLDDTCGIVVANSHLFWNWKYEWVRVKQAKRLLEEIVDINRDLGFAAVFCGDINATPETPTYKFLTTRAASERDLLQMLTPRDHRSDTISDLNAQIAESLSGLHWEPKSETAEEAARFEAAKQLWEEARRTVPRCTSVYRNYRKMVP